MLKNKIKMDVQKIINKIQKYAVRSIYSENQNKIGIKIYSNIGIWIYLIIYKENYFCKYTTAVETINKKRIQNELWKLSNLNDLYKILVRPKFRFICLDKNKPKELKNIKSVYSVKYGENKIQIFVKENDLYICFPKYNYNIYHAVYFKLQNFKQLYFAAKELFEKPEIVLKIYLVKMFWEVTINAKGKADKIILDDYLTNQYLLQMFSELVIKYREWGEGING